MWLLSLVVFVAIFSSLIVMHEAGHFWLARWAGIKVEEFGIGFGKKLWGKKIGETEYTLNAIPFGGFVRMLGEEESSNDPRSFERAALPWRMAVTVAGVAVNFIFAYLALVALFIVGTNPIIINQEDLQQYEASNHLQFIEPEDEKPYWEVIKPIQMPLSESVVFAGTEIVRLSVAMVERVAQIPAQLLIQHKIPDDLAGPVGIAEITHRVVPLGFWAVLKLTALLSISLGVLNLLPIPALDGGRLFFQLTELILRHKPNPSWERYVHAGGFLLLLALLLVITWGDISRLLGS